MTANSSTPSSPDDWAAEATRTVVETVDKVRDQTTAKALILAKALVYGPLILVFAAIVFVLMLIAGIRVLDLVLPIWGVYLALGIVFMVTGIFAWKKRGRLEPVT